MQGRIIKQLPNLVTAIIGAAVLIVVGYFVVSALTGGDEKSGAAPEIDLPANITGSAEFMGQVVPTSDNAYFVSGRWIAKPTAPVQNQTPVLPVTVSQAFAADQTAGEDKLVPEPEPETEDGKGITLKLSKFEDWVDGELSVKDTYIEDFSVFGSKKAAQDFADEFDWNSKHDFEWNLDELALYVANEYGESDPAPAVFFTSSSAYFVVLSDDGVTADVYQLDDNEDNEAKLIKKKSGEKSVYAVDQLETDAS